MANYPLVHSPTYVDAGHASEVDNPRYDKPDPFTGGSSGPVTQGRFTGLQPGFNVAGIPVAALDANTIAAIAGPQPG